MNHAQLENWVLEICDSVKARRPIEDDRVELKSEWIEPAKASRQLAGHANAARGGIVLWIIGVDQKGGQIVGAEENELADWYPQVTSYFDSELSPSMQHISVPIDSVRVVALLFETDRAPYVVKTAGRQILWETPWRQGEQTSTARRADLIRLLVPQITKPQLVALDAIGRCNRTQAASGYEWRWSIEVIVYIEIMATETLVIIPLHLSNASLKFNGDERPCDSVGFGIDRTGYYTESELSDRLVRVSDRQLLISGPGHVILSADTAIPTNVDDQGEWLPSEVLTRFRLVPLGEFLPIEVSAVLNRVDQTSTAPTHWRSSQRVFSYFG